MVKYIWNGEVYSPYLQCVDGAVSFSGTWSVSGATVLAINDTEFELCVAVCQESTPIPTEMTKFVTEAVVYLDNQEDFWPPNKSESNIDFAFSLVFCLLRGNLWFSPASY